jgi:hypothetical protein
MYLSIIILPLLGSIVSGFFGRKVGVTGSRILSCLSIITTTILAIISFFEVGFNNNPISINLFKWLDSESFNMVWNFQFDSLTVNSADSSYIWWILAVLVGIQLCKVIFLFIINSFLNIIKQMFKLIKNINFSSLLQLSSFFRGLEINNRILSKSYSTKQDKFYLWEEENFLKWFVGFSDAESNFNINILWKNDKVSISKFSFMFKIALHGDDANVLKLIKEKLGIGNIRSYKNEYIFNVTDKKGIEKLIQIFDKYNLNTTKYLDYLAFKKAFNIYNNKDKNQKIDTVKDAILELKESMNKKRVNFDRPDEIVINKYWLLGFIEGDGSFFMRRDNLVPTFAIELSAIQLPVILKIKEFLENNLGFDQYSLFKLRNSSIISITKNNARENSKASVSLIIKNIRVLHNYLIPFFNEMEFLSKKGLDFADFQIICIALYNGIHRIEGMKEIILKLSYNMNNYRLSTNKKSVEILSKEEIDKLININPTVKYLFDGRQIDILTNKVLHQQVSCVYEICKPNNEIVLANTLQEAALIVEVHPETLSRHLDSIGLIPEQYVELKKYKIRRIAVFN